jgi:hypothetical protein
MTIATGERLVATDITDLTFFPKGTILTFSSEAWSATSAKFKDIWKICNGQNGTPNLTNKFLRGSASSGATGDGQKQLSVDELPTHSHSAMSRFYFWGSNGGNGDASNVGAGYAPDVDSGGLKWVSLSSPTTVQTTIGTAGNGNSFEIIPAYYSVIYIIKVV